MPTDYHKTSVSIAQDDVDLLEEIHYSATEVLRDALNAIRKKKGRPPINWKARMAADREENRTINKERRELLSEEKTR
jgi:hypothetical protein